MDYTLLSGIIASLIFSIFFSGIEVAFLSANKLQIELLGKQGNLIGQVLTFFVDRPTWFIGTTLIGNIASLILFGVFTTEALLPLLNRLFPSVMSNVLIPVIFFTFFLTI